MEAAELYACHRARPASPSVRCPMIIVAPTARIFLFGLLASLAPLPAADVPFSAGREALKPAAALPQLSVQGNRFVNPAGETVVLRGLALTDPAALIQKGQWNRRYFEAAKSWNANVVRVPVHPA